jgi:hypothetical protein
MQHKDNVQHKDIVFQEVTAEDMQPFAEVCSEPNAVQ